MTRLALTGGRRWARERRGFHGRAALASSSGVLELEPSALLHGDLRLGGQPVFQSVAHVFLFTISSGQVVQSASWFGLPTKKR